MKMQITAIAACGVMLGFVPAGAQPQPSDIISPQKRKTVVEHAEVLANPRELAPLPLALVNPFSPQGFAQPDPEELKALTRERSPDNADFAAPATDQTILAQMAARLTPSGTIIVGGVPVLIFPKQKYRVGDHILETYEGRAYKLEITSISSTAFTLRLNAEVITRSTSSRKNP